MHPDSPSPSLREMKTAPIVGYTDVDIEGLEQGAPLSELMSMKHPIEQNSPLFALLNDK